MQDTDFNRIQDTDWNRIQDTVLNRLQEKDFNRIHIGVFCSHGSRQQVSPAIRLQQHNCIIGTLLGLWDALYCPNIWKQLSWKWTLLSIFFFLIFFYLSCTRKWIKFIIHLKFINYSDPSQYFPHELISFIKKKYLLFDP